MMRFLSSAIIVLTFLLSGCFQSHGESTPINCPDKKECRQVIYAQFDSMAYYLDDSLVRNLEPLLIVQRDFRHISFKLNDSLHGTSCLSRLTAFVSVRRSTEDTLYVDSIRTSWSAFDSLTNSWSDSGCPELVVPERDSGIFIKEIEKQVRDDSNDKSGKMKIFRINLNWNDKTLYGRMSIISKTIHPDKYDDYSWFSFEK